MTDLEHWPQPMIYESPGRLASHERAAMIGVFLAALALRVLMMWQLSRTPLWSLRPVDLAYYHDWALRILAGNAPREVFEQSPLYAWYLAAVYRCFGTGPLAPRLIQSVVGAVTCVLIARCAWRLCAPAAGLVAGLLAATYGPFLFYDTMLMKPVFSVFFFALTLQLLVASEGWKRGALVLAGVSLGLGALVRDNLILLVPVIAAWLVVDALLGTARLHRRRLLDVAASVASFVAGVALVVLPVTARNYSISGEFVPLTTGGGEVFYIGNNAEADGYYSPPSFVRASAGVEHEDFRTEAARRLGRPRGTLSRKQSSDYWLDQGLAWIRAHPGDWLALMARKALIFWNHYELPDNMNYAHLRRLCPILRAPVPVFGIIVPLAAAGLLLTRDRWRDLLLLGAAGCGYFATVMLFFNFGRFRLPMAAVLLVLSGGAIGGLVQALRRRRPWEATAALILFTIALAACNANLEEDPLHIGQGHATLATILFQAGRLEEADEESRLGVEELEAAWVRLGGRLAEGDHGLDLSGRHGVPPDAGRSFFETIAESYATRGAVLEARGRTAEASSWKDRARAVEVDPSLPPPGSPSAVPIREGTQAMEAGRYEEAATAFRAAIAELRPDSPRERLALSLRLAEAMHRSGRPREALDVVEKALDGMTDIPPEDHAAAHFGRALIYRDLGEPERMRFHMRECLRLNPHHPRAAWMREILAAWEKNPS